jgi:hypothetical protein
VLRQAPVQQSCTDGAVSGYALINGEAASFPSTCTSSSTFIPEGFNCAGSAPMVRRVGLGDFYVCFPAQMTTFLWARPAPERGLPANRG